jgi:hypothetical protein
MMSCTGKWHSVPLPLKVEWSSVILTLYTVTPICPTITHSGSNKVHRILLRATKAVEGSRRMSDYGSATYWNVVNWLTLTQHLLVLVWKLVGHSEARETFLAKV